MSYIAKATALAVVLALLAPILVLAGDYITDAAQALQHAPVYVAPGAEGTDQDTAGKLQARLNSGDNIVLVMLPSAAEAELGADISTIASRLSEKLGNQRIIGLAVGKRVVGYAPTLPAGVAADQMRRAESVSNDLVTALGTFVQNMHLWQAEHPQPKPSPTPTSSPLESPQEGSPQEGGLPGIVWLFALAGIAAIFVGFIISATSHGAVQINLAKIVKKCEQVSDGELKNALHQMCLDIENYFQPNSKDKKRDTIFFKKHLAKVIQVLDKYIDVQQNPRYYSHPEAELQKGKEAISEFSQYVLELIRGDHDADLDDYIVNTTILQTQRYL